MARAGVAASPLGLHSLQEISVDLNAEFWLPLLDKRWHHLVQEVSVPRMQDLGSFGFAAAWAHDESDAHVIKDHAGLGFLMFDIEEVTSAPEVVTLAGNELPGCFSGLVSQLFLLGAYPVQFGNGVGSGHLQSSRQRDGEGHVTMRWAHGKMNVLDVLQSYLDGNLAQLDRFGH